MCYQCTSSLIIWNDLFELSIKTDQNLKSELKKSEENNGSSVNSVNSNVSKAAIVSYLIIEKLTYFRYLKFLINFAEEKIGFYWRKN